MSRLFPGQALRIGGASLRLPRRLLASQLLLLTLILCTAYTSLMAGEIRLQAGDLLASINGEASRSVDFVIYKLRLPRIVAAVIAGAALAMSGAIFQSMARNSLASPDVIGFNSGAAFGAVLTMVLTGGNGWAIAAGAVTGGLCSAALVLALAWQKGLRPLRMVLIGIGIGYTAYAGVDFLMVRVDIFKAAQATQWLTGSLGGSNWQGVAWGGISLSLLLPLALGLQMPFNRLEMGDDTALALGVSIFWLRPLFALIGILLVALAVALAGPVAFVALVSGPIAKRLCAAPGACLGSSALVGAAVMLAADLAARTAFLPLQYPVGLFTAILGAPFLIGLLALQTRRRQI